MPLARGDLFRRLDELDVAHRTVEHAAVFTVEEGRSLKASMPGGHSKNLFLKDKKGGLYLAVSHCDTAVDLVGLARATAARGRFSFGRPEFMTAILGVIPGAVTPFALANATAKEISGVFIDKALLDWPTIWFHPLENTASTGISPQDLIRFIEGCGFAPRILDLANPLGGG